MEINLIDWLIEDGGSKHIRDKYYVSMATSELQPPSDLFSISFYTKGKNNKKGKEKKKSGKVQKSTIVSGKRYVWNSIPL